MTLFKSFKSDIHAPGIGNIAAAESAAIVFLTQVVLTTCSACLPVKEA